MFTLYYFYIGDIPRVVIRYENTTIYARDPSIDRPKLDEHGNP